MAQAAITTTQPDDGYNVKRSVFRVLGFSILTSNLYYLYWFYVTRQQLNRELKSNDNSGLQTVGLIVPILQTFIMYWLYRDINKARDTQKLSPFPAVWYAVLPSVLLGIGLVVIIGALIAAVGSAAAGDLSSAIAGGVFGLILAILLIVAGAILHLVFWGTAISKLNEYWDKRTSGKAQSAKFGKGEIAVIVVGVLINVANAAADRPHDRYKDDDYRKAIDNLQSNLATPAENTSGATPQQVYDQVQNGMTPTQVRAVAGREPDSKNESNIAGAGNYEYWTFRRGASFVSLTFTNGALSDKSIYK